MGGQLLYAIMLLACAAPAPIYRHVPLQVVPGKYEVDWSGTRGLATLHPNGCYECEWGGLLWIGMWSWDSKTRTYYVYERSYHSDDLDLKEYESVLTDKGIKIRGFYSIIRKIK